MQVVVVGAAGFLGRPVTRAFSRAGHVVRGVVRSETQYPQVIADGGIPILGDVRDRSSMDRAVQGSEVVVHLASVAGGPDLAAMRSARVDGAAVLAQAARQAHVPRLLVGSGYWVYADSPGTVSETSPTAPRSISQVNWDAEEASAPGAGGPEVVVVRPGMVYGNGSWFGEMVQELRAGTYRYVGDGANYMAPIHRDDLGEAFRIIGERAPGGSRYLAVDDGPVPVREFAYEVARWIGAAPPTAIPFDAAARKWGEDLARLNAASRRASNQRLRDLGWNPGFPTFRDGVPKVLEEIGPTRSDGPR